MKTHTIRLEIASIHANLYRYNHYYKYKINVKHECVIFITYMHPLNNIIREPVQFTD